MSRQIPLQQAMQLAARHREAGQLREAEAICRQVLNAQPDCADAFHIMGLIARQTGQQETAVDLLSRAIRISPQSAQYHADLASLLAVQGRYEEASTAYQNALRAQPRFALAWLNLGNVLRKRGQPEKACVAYRECLALDSAAADAWQNLSLALFDSHRTNDAIVAAERALALQPDSVDTRFALGNALAQNGELDRAIAVFQELLGLRPNLPSAYLSLGDALWQSGRIQEAIKTYEGAAETIRPTSAETYNQLGVLLGRLGRFDEEAQCYHHILQLKPDHAVAHANLGVNLLRAGDFAHGFAEFEWRMRITEPKRFCAEFKAPLWQGENLADRTLLLHSEQGFGDAIQFLRFLPQLTRLGPKLLVLQCPTELVRLIKSMCIDMQVISRDDPLPDFDSHCPLLSAPARLKTTIHNIPADIPYVHADPQLAERFRSRVSGSKSKLNVGLAWLSGREYRQNYLKSLSLNQLETLFQLPSVAFYSLQKSLTGDEISKAKDLKLTDWTNEFNDFSDTAALVENLDLIISVDTAVAHLAGAMGKPVWVLLPFVADWRWMNHREDSPWYPTMRLFRQRVPGRWEAVIGRIVTELINFAAARS